MDFHKDLETNLTELQSVKEQEKKHKAIKLAIRIRNGVLAKKGWRKDHRQGFSYTYTFFVQCSPV